jgi:hypothetical protein
MNDWATGTAPPRDAAGREGWDCAGPVSGLRADPAACFATPVTAHRSTARAEAGDTTAVPRNEAVPAASPDSLAGTIALALPGLGGQFRAAAGPSRALPDACGAWRAGFRSYRFRRPSGATTGRAFRFRLTVAASTRTLVLVELIKRQRNDIFAAVVAGGLDPIECDLTSDADDSKVNHIPSGSYLTFSYASGVFNGSGWIPDGPRVGFQSPNWSFVVDRVKYWAEEVKQTLELPDLWAELRRGMEFLGEVQGISSANTPFTPAEQVSVN